MDILQEKKLYDELMRLYNKTKNTVEPFTFAVRVKKGINRIFLGTEKSDYTNVGIVNISSYVTSLVGFEFTPESFSEVTLKIHNRPDKNDIPKFIEAANSLKTPWTLVDADVEKFLNDISSKFGTWKYNTTSIDTKLIDILGDKYNEFFTHVKNYDGKNNSHFYDILKIKNDDFESKIKTNKVKFIDKINQSDNPENGNQGLGSQNKASGGQGNQGTQGDDPKHPLNLILYGPPGTGKTYNTLFHALAIIENEKVEDIEAKCKKIDELHKNDPTNNPEDGYTTFKGQYDKLVEQGRIVFTTFHQSMSYEDFIEGIKPELDNDPIKAVHKNEVGSATTITQFGDGTTTIDNLSRMKYVVKDGIFKKMCYTFQLVVDQFKHKYPIGSVISGSGGASITIRDYKDVYSIPCIQFEWGTKGHTNVVQIRAIQRIIEEDKSFEFDTYEKYCEAISPKGKKGNAATTSHSHYYKIFYNELKKIFDDLKQEKILASSLKKVLIIDEINRGNVSQIFGELITLIEESKRTGDGQKEAMTATLPYSQETFGVPNNLYIIGTMNTADRSVEALDTALRRRFSFEEMMPDTSKVKGDIEITYTDKSSASKKERILFSELLSTINERIALLKDREHQIGHSYFMGYEKAGEVKKWLKKVFKDNIIPLLQEYFYGDYKKIYYVLGGEKVNELKPNPDAGFVLIQEMPKAIQAVFAGDVDDSEVDIAEARYEINTIDENFNIDIAIAKLMKKI